jgi:hypothetical protein
MNAIKVNICRSQKGENIVSGVEWRRIELCTVLYTSARLLNPMMFFFLSKKVAFSLTK